MDTLALILSIIGCVNWGLVGIFQFDLVAWLFGGSGAVLLAAIFVIACFNVCVGLISSCGEYFADITVSDAKTGEEYYSNAEN